MNNWIYASARCIKAMLFVMTFCFFSNNHVIAQTITVTAATGGTNISLDTHSSSTGVAWTTLTDIVITETAVNQITVGAHTINLPTEWQFDIVSTVTINNGGSEIVLNSTSVNPAANTITFDVTTASSTNPGSLTFSGIKIQPTGVTTPSSGNLSSDLTGDNYGSLSTIAGAAAKYLVTTAGPYYAGTTITANAQLADQFDNPVSTPGLSVTWSKTGAGGGFLASPTTTNASGIATTTFTMDNVVGITYTITATDAGSLTGTSAGFTTVVGPASAYRISAATTTPVAGVNNLLTLSIVDQFQNVVTTFDGTKNITFSGLAASPNATIPTVTNNSGTPTNLGSVTTITFDDGISTVGGFLVAYKAEGPVTLNATDGTLTSSSPGGTGVSLTVAPGTVSLAQTSVSVSSASIAVGSTSTVTLQAKDTYGNNLTTGGATVGFSLGAGTSTGTFGAVTDNNNGSYTAVFTGTVAGTARTITATYNGSNVTSTLPTITVTASTISTATSTVAVSSPTVVAGYSVTLTLQAKNSLGNNINTGGATVQFSISGGTSTGIIGAVSDNGNGTYTATFTGQTSGTATTVHATINGSAVTTTMPTITVTPGTATHLLATPAASAMAVGQTNEITLSARDAYGNIATSYFGIKTISYSGLQGAETMEGTTSPIAVTFTSGLSTVGALTFQGYVIRAAVIHFSDGLISTVGNVSYAANINISATLGPVTNFLVESVMGGVIGTQNAGIAFNIKITARDASNNAVSNFTGTVNISDNSGSISPTLSAAFVNGVLTTAVTITKATQACIITVTKTNGAGETGSSNAFIVNGGPIAYLKATPEKSVMFVNQTNEITLRACDAYGNTVTTYSGNKTIQFVYALQPGETIEGSSTSAVVTFTNGVSAAGALTFQALFIRNAYLDFSDGVYSTTGNQDRAAHVIVTVAVNNFLVESSGGSLIGTQSAGSPFSIRITARDANNNVVTGFIGKVNITTNADTISPVLSSSFTNGVLSAQSVTIIRAKTGCTITVTNYGGSGESGTSNAFNVNPGAVSYLKAVPATSSMLNNTANEITLTARDAYDNIATTYNGAKTITFSGLQTGETIESSTSSLYITFTNGVSPAGALTYNAKVIRTAILNFTDGIYNTSGNSANAATIVITDLVNKFSVEAANGSTIGAQVAGAPFNIKITARSANNSKVSGFNGTVNLVVNVGVISPTVTGAFVNGELTIPVKVFKAQTGCIITATNTAPTAETGNSNAFNVSPGVVAYLKATPTDTLMFADQTNEITLTARDSSGNIATTYNGQKTITFTGLEGQEKIENTNIALAITFASGVSQAGALTFRALVARRAVLNFSDGTYNTLGDTTRAAHIRILSSIPAAPVATAATNINVAEFQANWNASGGATTYYIDIATDNAFDNPVSGFINKNVGNVTSYVVTGLIGNTTYFYRVRAGNSIGTSLSSNVISVTTLLGAPETPVANTATDVTDHNFVANWTLSVNASGYFLDVATNSSFTSPVSGYIGKNVGNVNFATVSGLSPLTTYYYRVRAYNSKGESANSNTVIVNTITSTEWGDKIPTEFELMQNYPNPFNPTTTIVYAIPKESFVKITIYSILGKEVATVVNDYKTTGYHKVTFDAGNLASGLYLYKITADEFTEIKKMLLMK